MCLAQSSPTMRCPSSPPPPHHPTHSVRSSRGSGRLATASRLMPREGARATASLQGKGRPAHVMPLHVALHDATCRLLGIWITHCTAPPSILLWAAYALCMPCWLVQGICPRQEGTHKAYITFPTSVAEAVSLSSSTNGINDSIRRIDCECYL